MMGLKELNKKTKIKNNNSKKELENIVKNKTKFIKIEQVNV